jgi:hypothetical protein
MSNLHKLAHESDDDITPLHCFAGETRYLTRDGVKTLAETVGTSQMVLTADPEVQYSASQRFNGRWVEAEVRSFGEQSLMKVTFQRNRSKKIVYATPGHRWLVVGGPKRSLLRTVTTEHLRSGQRIPALYPKSRIAQTTVSLGWAVESVEATDRVEEVFCAVVPETGSFVLEDNLWTRNCPFCGSGKIVANSDGSIGCQYCQRSFTVRVQPAFSAMPQQMDQMNAGAPDFGPGGQGDPSANGPGGGAPQDAADQGVGPSLEQNSDPAASNGPPVTDQQPDSDGTGAPWMYNTSTGARLSEQDYLDHLAVAFAGPQRARVIAQIKSDRARG